MNDLFESGFDRFWSAWPKSTRKGAKTSCKARWAKGYYETCADQIIKHVEWMKTTDQWRKDGGVFIPAPLVYLNQQRWDGADIPESFGKPAEQIIDPALVKIQQDRAKAVGIPDHIREKMRQIRMM